MFMNIQYETLQAGEKQRKPVILLLAAVGYIIRQYISFPKSF